MERRQYTTKDVVVFCDFDGTITQRDLGDEVFRQYIKLEPLQKQLLRRELSIAEYWQRLCEAVPDENAEQAIREFALAEPADPYFRTFTEFCREHGMPLFIVSDGFDTYINPVLEREGASELPRFTNRLLFASSGTPEPVFPLASESCQCFCASCKRNAVLNVSASDSLIVFIGDGYSDFCAAEHADIVFAKKALAAHCTKHRIPHHPFHTFFDVLRVLKKLVDDNSLRPRHQARLRRKEAFEIE